MRGTRSPWAVALLSAGVLLAGCSSGDGSADDADDGDGDDRRTPTSDTTESAASPGGEVVFDFRARKHTGHPAVRAYVSWQRAATSSLRQRELSDAVTAGARDAPVETVERSIETMRESDYTVPRRMVGRLQTMRPTSRAAILDACLWSPTFDYRERSSGDRATDEEARWMGVEVRMTRTNDGHGRWVVAGISAREDCKGSRP